MIKDNGASDDYDENENPTPVKRCTPHRKDIVMIPLRLESRQALCLGTNLLFRPMSIPADIFYREFTHDCAVL